jgi:metal-dependent hydrolase (beta-lactamase superfamily II)
LVITHEHLDHIEGFYSTKSVFGDPSRMKVDYVWMSLPSDPDYYDDYPSAEPHKRLREMTAAYHKALTRRSLELAPGFETMLRNNLSNVDRLNFIKGLANKSVKYLRRGNRTQNRAFSDATAHILAPEKDMSVYYSSSAHNSVTAMAEALSPTSAQAADWWSFPKAATVDDGRPPNLTERDWNQLKAGIEGGGPEAIRTIDKAQNNTSLVFILEVDGKRLLFPGDAEIESWELLQDKASSQMKPVDFLKVSHHGSHNGSLESAMDKLLPKSNAANAVVMVSTKSKVYGTVNPVPDEDTLLDLEGRCSQLISTEDHPDDLFVQVVLP